MNNRVEMTREEQLFEATRFRRAIEKAKSAGEFDTHSFKFGRMNNFPHQYKINLNTMFVSSQNVPMNYSH